MAAACWDLVLVAPSGMVELHLCVSRNTIFCKIQHARCKMQNAEDVVFQRAKPGLDQEAQSCGKFRTSSTSTVVMM